MLRWLWGFVGPYRSRLIVALIALVLTSALTLSLGQGVKLLVDEGFAAGSHEGLKDSLQIMLVLIVALALGAYFRFFMVSWIGERVVADIRKRLYGHLLTLTPSFFEDNLAGEIQSRVTTDTALLQTVIGSSLSFALRNVLIFVGGLVLMFISNLKLSLMVIAVVPLIVFPLIFIGRKVKRLSKQSQDEVASVGAWAGESLQNIKVVQAFTRESHVAEQFDQGAEQAFAVALQRIRYRAFLIALVMIMVMGAITAMLYVGGSDVISGELSAGDLSAFVFYAVMVAGSLAAVTEVYGELQRAAGAVERIRELLATQPTILDKGGETVVKDHSGSAAIELNNVSFAYPSRPDQWALQDVSLKIQAGQSTALVGPSGAGKSTLFDLLLHFREPQKGDIFINNQNIADYPLAMLRNMYALVPQNPVLFSSNVWDNIRFAKPDATDQEVIDACKAAHAYDFIMALPEQFDSFLGEQGVKLSGGQKQRIAIARAILRDPDVLLLDEATSALDAQSEFWVQQALNELMRDRTTLIIAHRLSTVRHVDQIALFDQGRITAVGNHSQLMQNSDLYKRLAELQFQGETEA
ncbi:ATP-binding cassette domain-containing protein [Bermanella marisrubri]|uniref:ABC transporter, ATP-binding/permease protein n=1 Tax=Bermanella marisrubri TaxID=207949 RepID=Q1N5X6_9GAMM|nr:ABC transporter transmembrane domain-containing protein [Bermanella marisrubri]EAT13816.1 ABC transporter, ATP-binding/permease protein [Oceanobacter sp. RED65] [Bermanella marisrubri]QIZ84582.1 ATP-binding cassette domain-containing protein [Bermanella marisrubri]